MADTNHVMTQSRRAGSLKPAEKVRKENRKKPAEKVWKENRGLQTGDLTAEERNLSYGDELLHAVWNKARDEIS